MYTIDDTIENKKDKHQFGTEDKLQNSTDPSLCTRQIMTIKLDIKENATNWGRGYHYAIWRRGETFDKQGKQY